MDAVIAISTLMAYASAMADESSAAQLPRGVAGQRDTTQATRPTSVDTRSGRSRLRWRTHNDRKAQR